MAVSDNLERSRLVAPGRPSLTYMSIQQTNLTHPCFLYARKSTDVEDVQVQSIESQLAELREYAARENISIVEELVEKQSAKIPGRPIFNDMISRIENGEASGIVSWHPDRLARNSVDGGKLIYLVDTGKIKLLKFPQFWFESTPQGKFMLTIAFGQSKYFVDSLSENTKRGLRQKVRLGIMPGVAPAGYLNDPRTKTIIIDRKKAPVVQEAFEMFATGTCRIMDIADFWRSMEFSAETAECGNNTAFRTLFSPILFIMVIFGMVAKSTKVLTSHWLQRNCLTLYRRYGRNEVTPGTRNGRSSSTPDFFVVASAA